MLAQLVNKITGISIDNCEAFVSLFLSIPIGCLYNYLFKYIECNTKLAKEKQKQLRCIYICSITIYLMFVFLDGFGISNILFSIIFNYFIIKKLKSSVKSVIAIFVLNIIHLLYCHVYRQFEAVEKFDFTSPFMCLIIKMVLYTWARYDSTRSEKELNEYQKKSIIKEEPSFLEFLAYSLFFPGFFTGPACDYYEFRDFLNKNYSEKEEFPGRLDAVKKNTIKAILYLIIFVSINKYNYFFLLNENILAKPFIIRVILLNFAGFVCRSKYYLAWKFADVSYNLVGMGYNGTTKDGKPKWDGLENATIKNELSDNAIVHINNWNVRTSQWLRHSIYERIIYHYGKSSSSWAVYLVEIVTAIWHGVYPGYFLTFILAATINYVVKAVRRTCRPFFAMETSPYHKYKKAYDIAGLIITQMMINFSAAPFILLTIDKSILLWKSYHYFVLIGIIGTIIALKFFGLQEFLYKKQKEILGVSHEKKYNQKPQSTTTATTEKPVEVDNDKIKKN